MAVNAVDPAPTGDEVPPNGLESAGDGPQARIAELIDASSGLAHSSGDWTGVVALELAEKLLDSEQAELSVDDDEGVEALNMALYRMSYEAALACEHARQLGAGARRSHTTFEPASSAAGGSQSGAATMRQRLRSALGAGGDDPDMETVETIGQLARMLCLGLIDAYKARDRYDYAGIEAALDACDTWLPAGCTLKSFRVLECMRAVAQAGLSRDEGGTPPGLQGLTGLAELVSEDRNALGGSHVDHALLLLVSAVGHMQRSQLVDEAARGRADTTTSRVDWILGVLQGMEERGVAQARDWPTANQPNPVAHHVHYYRHFAHHVRAIALANQLKESVANEAGDTPAINVSMVRNEYREASASLERALQLVPPSNEARWRYYDLNAENLEHEESLRIELLEQRLSTRQTVKRLAEANVQRLSDEAKEELRSRMADVSMRIVEIIGVFLAVVAILGATVASATVDGLSLGGRILILIIGGSMPVVYFVLLRWIVTGKLSKRRSRD